MQSDSRLVDEVDRTPVVDPSKTADTVRQYVIPLGTINQDLREMGLFGGPDATDVITTGTLFNRSLIQYNGSTETQAYTSFNYYRHRG